MSGATLDAVSIDDAPPASTWIAAYAMGLVTSDRHDAIEEMVPYVSGAGAPVRDAMIRLDDPAVGDAQLRSEARALIDAAVVRAGVDIAGSGIATSSR